MLNHVAINSPDAPQRLYAALTEGGEALWSADAASYLRSQLDLSAAQPAQLPQQYDQLAGWISHHAQSMADAYHRYQVAREYGAPRRHFATVAQARRFLREAAPARLADGASLYGVVERWDDIDFQPMIASYLELLGNGVPDRNRHVVYRDLLAAAAGSGWTGTGALPPERYVSAAVELAMAYNGDDFLPELIGYNMARQQPSSELLVARHELSELGLDADSFAPVSAAAGSGPSALLSLRGVMARVGDPAAFYRRVADGYRLHTLVAHLPLPAAADAGAPLQEAHTPAIAPDAAAGAAASHAPAGARAEDRLGTAQPDYAEHLDSHTGGAHGGHRAGAAPAGSQPAHGQHAARHAGGRGALHAVEAGMHAEQPAHAARPVIRHHFPADEHAWETIGCELRLLEARLAASDSKEEAMATLSRLLSPALQHSPAGLMAGRIYSQLFNL
ncbi:iron-containing redox enzyme family protein [Pseudoduganella sp. LjRoot289]|uniref:hypothetical protein n=1 Tax=Pseudoduganella sp. LjRoot289 TaxID=3342314 RepID=UPI003ECEDB32